MLPAAFGVEYTGYVVDNFCWAKPEHKGIDGTPLGTKPEDHKLYCLEVQKCADSGFVMLEKLAAADADGDTYGPKYQLDKAGDDLVLEMVKAEMKRTGGGSYSFDVQATVTGTVSGEEMAVTKLCVTPTKDNADNHEFCYPVATPTTTTTMTAKGNETSAATTASYIGGVVAAALAAMLGAQ